MMTFTGELAGVKIKTVENKKSGEVWDNYIIGLSTPKIGGYKGETIIQDIQITKNQVKAGLVKKFELLVGKKISVEFFITARAWKELPYLTYLLAGDGEPLAIDGKLQSVKAA